MVRTGLSIVLLSATLTLGACGADSDTPPATPPPDALKTASGLASKMLRVGLGSDHPTVQSRVTVNYTGWTPDGKMFDSSPKSGPLTFPLDQVIPGWTEGVQLMVTGEKRRFWIPGALAYDKIDQPGAPKGPLIFDIELLAIH